MVEDDDKNPLEYVSDIEELMQLHEFMKDDSLAEALDIMLKLIVKPEVPSAKAMELIVRLQAYSAKFQILAVTHQTLLKKTAGAMDKKNIYYAVYYALDKLVNALKVYTR